MTLFWSKLFCKRIFMTLCTHNTQPKCGTITLFPHMPLFQHQRVTLFMTSFPHNFNSVHAFSVRFRYYLLIFCFAWSLWKVQLLNEAYLKLPIVEAFEEEDDLLQRLRGKRYPFLSFLCCFLRLLICLHLFPLGESKTPVDPGPSFIDAPVLLSPTWCLFFIGATPSKLQSLFGNRWFTILYFFTVT